MKIIDRIRKRQQDGQPFFSFEYFSPKTAQGMVNLHDRIERMCHLGPEFVDITWGAGGSRPAATMEVVSLAQKVYGVETCMHLICTNNPTDKIDRALKEARACGNQNILALRGDPIQGQKEWTPCTGGFCFASDLVRHIRKTHGDYFGIGVAGYPEVHPESSCPDQDIIFLKQKLDAGADFIVTQLFFDVPLFLDWVRRCRAIGIKCPILPGLMPIQSYGGFIKNTIGLSVPTWIRDGIEAVKHDDQAVREFGVEVGIQMTKELIAGGVPGIHFYTFNLEKSTKLILEGSGLIPTPTSNPTTTTTNPKVVSSTQSHSLATLAGPHGWNLGAHKKSRPWRCSFDPKRKTESVRPIFWNNRPKSYISRTVSWTQFPVVTAPTDEAYQSNKSARDTCCSPRPRSDSGSDQTQFSSPFFKVPTPTSSSSTSSPCSSTTSLPLSSTSPRFALAITDVIYGDLDGYGVGLKYSSAVDAQQHWGAVKSLQDLQQLFSRYCRGEALTLPWCDQSLALPALVEPSFARTLCVREKLAELTNLGYLPVNARPGLSDGGCKSEDKVFGWGPRGGQVYQRGYLEFFVSPSQFRELKSRIQNTTTRATPAVSFAAVNRAGDLHTNISETETKVVDWGVFPAVDLRGASFVTTTATETTRTEVATVVDLSSFWAWKEEAFALWDQWSDCFENGSESQKNLKSVGQDWYLMFLVQDSPCQGQDKDLFCLFEEELQEHRLEQPRQQHDASSKEALSCRVSVQNTDISIVQESVSCSA